ncbi:MAG: PRD domain-containing protein [Actinomycetota bacterium]
MLLAYLGSDAANLEQQAARIAVGIRERLNALPLQEAAAIVRNSPIGQRLAAGRGELVFSLYVAVTIARIREDRPVDTETGRQRSVLDHPVAEAVTALVPRLEELIGEPMEEAEISAVTEYLLGLDTLQVARAVAEPEEEALVDELLTIAGERLHPALAEDPELRRGMLAHIGRLRVRLRHGLPVHNPLLNEVRDRYRDVHEVALELGETLESHLGSGIGEDEVGFLTMYLCGAMERARLRPRRRALVVCPSGMATVWVLVSRIQAEFPELELVEVLSETKYEALDHRDYDLVITTVPVDEHAAPVVVVGALLSAGDVARVAEHV